MTTLTYTSGLPIVGLPDATEDVKINGAFTDLLTWANGNVSFSNTDGSVAASATSWTALTLASSIIVGTGYTPSVRIDPGGVIRLKGAMNNATGGAVGAFNTVATIPASPAGMRPASGLWVAALAVSGGATSAPGLTVSSAGLIQTTASWPNGADLKLDGITFTVT